MRNLFVPFCVLTVIFPLTAMSEGYHDEYKNILEQAVINAEQDMNQYQQQTGAPGLYFDVTATEGLLADYFLFSAPKMEVQFVPNISNTLHTDSSVSYKTAVTNVSRGDTDRLNRARDMFDQLATKNGGRIYHEDLYKMCRYAFYGQIDIRLPEHLVNSVLIPCYETFVNRLVELGKYMEVTYENIHGSDLTRFDQECTEPLYYENGAIQNFRCISTKYNDDPAFQKAWITQLRIEAPVCEDVGDGAGMTCFGVTEKNYPQVVEKLPDFTIPDAEDIAYNEYYKKYRYNELPDALRGDFFSIAWNQGTGNAIKVMKKLQQIVGLPEEEIDGYYGDTTKQAILNYKGPDLRQQITAARWLLHQGSNKSNKFLNGWAVQDVVVMENGCHSENKNDAPLLIKPKTQPAKCLTTRNSYLGIPSPDYYSEYINRFKQTETQKPEK